MNFILALVFTASTLFGQSLLKSPNKSVKGIREGLWSEFIFSQIIDSTGEYHLEYGYHSSPKSVIAEGHYVNGEKEGLWKEYWIVDCSDTKSPSCRGGLKSITEYKNGVPCGVKIEYYKNGSINAIGQYETYPVGETQKLVIPDWRYPNSDKLKDTIIYVRARHRASGKWHFFKPDGSLWK